MTGNDRSPFHERLSAWWEELSPDTQARLKAEPHGPLPPDLVDEIGGVGIPMSSVISDGSGEHTFEGYVLVGDMADFINDLQE
jgi:hypothetical protein